MSGYNFINETNIAMDDNGHGTAVAGIIGAIGDNQEGIAGITWGPKLLPLKVMDLEGYGTYMNLAQGIIYAVENNAKTLRFVLTF